MEIEKNLIDEKRYDYKCYNELKRLLKTNENFRNIVIEGYLKGKITGFTEEEFQKISSQNFVSPFKEMKEFMDMFKLGYNIGNCVGTSRQLSYSYKNVDLVTGILPIIKGTLNAEKEGGHGWIETPSSIIDTTLMLIIDKSLKSKIGYIEEERLTSFDLACMPNYQSRKEFVNDKNLRKK